MKLFTHPATYAALYLLGFVVTFGHAYHRCQKTAGEPVKMGFSSAEVAAVDACICSMGWPLYWSAQAFTPRHDR